MNTNVETLLSDVKAELLRVGGETKSTAENAMKEAGRAGELSAQTRADVDKTLAKFHELSAAQAKLEGALEGLSAKHLDLAQHVTSGTMGRGGQARQTLGQAVASKEAIAAFVANGARGSLVITVENAITSAAGSGGGVIWEMQETEAVPMARRALRIRQLIGQSNTGSDLVKYPRQTTRTNAAAPVAEGAAAPESTFGWTKAEASVRKIAHIVHATEEALADSAQLQGLLDGEARFGLDLVEEQQILLGSGTGENLSGLFTNATAFAAADGLPNATAIDRLRLALLQVALNDYAADAIVLNPTDWAGIELLKDTTGQFIFGQPGGAGAASLWRLPVVESNTMTAGSWLVGAMQMAATLYDRQVTEVLISSEHANNFVEGMLTIKASKRLALAVKRPASLVKGNFTFG